ncbi:MAG: FAD-binding oxidoreductase [Steroidobacteraceae bacterium]
MLDPRPNDSGHIDSWYTVSAALPPAHAPLAGDTDCDVCVVGAGITGCSTALHLAERGYRIVVLEAQRIGWGASGRSGGQAIFGIAAGQAKLERLMGAGDARLAWDTTVEGLALIKSLIAKHRIDCDWVDGQMQVAIKARHEAVLRAEVEELHDQYGYRSVRFMPRDAVRATIASERYVAALYDSNSGHLHPLRYTLGLAAAAERAGARIFERTRVLGHTDGSKVRVRTSQGVVTCSHLVYAGNALLGGAAPRLGSRIMAVGTYVVATEPLGAERAAALIRNNAAVADMNWVLDYFRRTADHRLLFGGRVSYSGLDPFSTGRATRARMIQVFPQLATARIDHAWGGLVDITFNRAPDFGRLAPNVWYLQGFSGHGMVLTGIAGKITADAIAGTTERFDVFARIRHHSFYGGALIRRPALVLAMLWYRLRDLL